MAITDTQRYRSVETFTAEFPTWRTTSYLDPPPGSRGPQAHIRTLAWSPLGNYVATGALDRKLRVWNPERAQVKHSTELRGHTGSVDCVAWQPLREAELASCSPDGTVRVWDVRTRSNVSEVKIPGKEIFTLCWTPDGKELVAGSKDDIIYRISTATNTVIEKYQQPIQTNHVAFSWSGQELFLTGGDGTIKILDYPTMETLYSFRAHTSSCFSVDLSPNGSCLAVGGTDALTSLWDTETWLCKRTLPRMVGPVRSVSFSWCGGYIVAGGEEDKTIEVTHVDTGDVIHKIECGPAPIAQWSPKDYSLAYAVNETSGGLRIINEPKKSQTTG